MSSPTEPTNRSSIFAESNRIVTAYNGHFSILLLLFIFPFFICLITPLTFLPCILSQPNFHLFYYANSSNPISLFLLYALLVVSLRVAGVATITYSTKQGLYGKPLNLSSTLSSLSKSFFPLASTTLTSIGCLLLASFAFLIFFASFLNSLIILGFDIKYTLTFFTQFRFIIFSLIIVLFLILSHLILTIAAVISVVESKWWFEPLRQSLSLVRAMKQSSISILLLHGISSWLFLLGFSTQIITTIAPWSYMHIFQIFYVSFFWTTYMVPFVNVCTVLYLNCKDLHEELGFDIAVEISKDCVNLVIDDKKLVNESNTKDHVSLAAVMVLFGSFIVWTNFANWECSESM